MAESVLNRLAPETVRVVDVREVPMASVSPSPFQPRKQLDPLVIDALKESISAVGILQRPRVRVQGDAYELVFGHQRAEACRQLGYETLPVEVVECDDLAARRMTLHENIKSTRLHPIEHAEAISKFLDAVFTSDPDYAAVPGETHAERLAAVITAMGAENPDDLSPAAVFARKEGERLIYALRELANKSPRGFLTADLSLLRLPEEILQTTVEKGLKKGHARLLGQLLEQQPDRYEEVLSRGLQEGESEEWIPLEHAPVASLRQLVKPKKVELESADSDAYLPYIPVGVPGAPPAAESDAAPWEDEPADGEAFMGLHAVALGGLAEATEKLTALAPAEFVALVTEAGYSERAAAKAQVEALFDWLAGVRQALEA